MAASTQLGVLQPLQGKERTFEFPELRKRERQAVLAGIGRELAQDDRRRDPSRFDRDRKAKQFGPLVDILKVKSPSSSDGAGMRALTNWSRASLPIVSGDDLRVVARKWIARP